MYNEIKKPNLLVITVSLLCYIKLCDDNGFIIADLAIMSKSWKKYTKTNFSYFILKIFLIKILCQIRKLFFRNLNLRRFSLLLITASADIFSSIILK